MHYPQTPSSWCFVSRRGQSFSLYSDNGTNVKGATAKLFKKLTENIKRTEKSTIQICSEISTHPAPKNGGGGVGKTNPISKEGFEKGITGKNYFWFDQVEPVSVGDVVAVITSEVPYSW